MRENRVSQSEEYDVVVIGAGPAGETAAITASLLGKHVALIEKSTVVGGAAVNTGTIPSKTLRETALALSGLRSRDLYGVDLSLRRGATIDDFLFHERSVKTTQRKQNRKMFDRYNVKLIQGTASFVDPHTLKVVNEPAHHEELIRGESIVIAIGSVPVRPPGIPFVHNRVHDSDLLLEIEQLPKSMAIVGAGVIGSEYACMFSALGVKITLVDGRNTLLSFLDKDLSAALMKEMQNLGIEFIWNENVVACPDPGGENVKLTLSSGRILETDHVLICAGRESRTESLNPQAAGLTTIQKGRVAVNDHYQTCVPHIYAVGDVIGFPALASTSAEQGRVAACHICESAYATTVARVLPTGIYTIPELSAAGKTEQQCQEEGIQYVVGQANYSYTPRGKIIGDDSGFLKLIFEKESMKLLGVHVIGELATEVLHIGLLVLMTDTGSDLLMQTCFNYPTLGELYKYATYDAILKRPGSGLTTDHPKIENDMAES